MSSAEDGRRDRDSTCPRQLRKMGPPGDSPPGRGRGLSPWQPDVVVGINQDP